MRFQTRGRSPIDGVLVCSIVCSFVRLLVRALVRAFARFFRSFKFGQSVVHLKCLSFVHALVYQFFVVRWLSYHLYFLWISVVFNFFSIFLAFKFFTLNELSFNIISNHHHRKTKKTQTSTLLRSQVVNLRWLSALIESKISHERQVNKWNMYREILTCCNFDSFY